MSYKEVFLSLLDTCSLSLSLPLSHTLSLSPPLTHTLSPIHTLLHLNSSSYLFRKCTHTHSRARACSLSFSLAPTRALFLLRRSDFEESWNQSEEKIFGGNETDVRSPHLFIFLLGPIQRSLVDL